MTECNEGIGARRGGSGVSPDNRERSRSNEKPSRPQRIQALGFFFTYPQCPAIKEFLVDFLLKSFKVKEYVVASEKHEDGSPHLHAFVKVEKKIQFKPTMGDFIYEGVTYHGNYQVAKCWRAVQKYCIKEGDYLSNIDVKSAIAKEGKKVDLSKVLNGEMKLTEYVEADPSRLMSLGKLQQGLAIYKSLKEREKPDCVDSIPNDWNIDLKLYGPDGTDGGQKKRHYWIWSNVPNRGKTTWLRALQAEYRCSFYSHVENFQSVAEDSQFILFDEYTRPALRSTQINQMADGTYQYPVKGGVAVQPKMSPVLLVCGNRHPRAMYPNAWQFIAARFTVIDVSTDQPKVETDGHELPPRQEDS